MIKTKTETIEQEDTTIVAKQCDKCKKEYDDIFEMQEFHHVRFTGGYGSIFGDETMIECDICQHCLLEIIRDYMRSQYLYGE